MLDLVLSCGTRQCLGFLRFPCVFTLSAMMVHQRTYISTASSLDISRTNSASPSRLGSPCLVQWTDKHGLQGCRCAPSLRDRYFASRVKISAACSTIPLMISATDLTSWMMPMSWLHGMTPASKSPSSYMRLVAVPATIERISPSSA